MKKKILLIVVSLSLMSAGASADDSPSKLWSGFKTVVGCPLATVVEVPVVAIGALGAVVFGVVEVTSRVFNQDIDPNMTTAQEIRSSKEMAAEVFTKGCLENVRELRAKTEEYSALKRAIREQAAMVSADGGRPARKPRLAD